MKKHKTDTEIAAELSESLKALLNLANCCKVLAGSTTPPSEKHKKYDAALRRVHLAEVALHGGEGGKCPNCKELLFQVAPYPENHYFERWICEKCQKGCVFKASVDGKESSYKCCNCGQQGSPII